jgi:hypothetical protein
MRQHGSKKLNAMVDEAGRQWRAAGYRSLFAGMRHEYGTASAMKKLFVSPNIQTGLDRCLDLGLRSLEDIALECPRTLTEAELACAKWKLRYAKLKRRKRA